MINLEHDRDALRKNVQNLIRDEVTKRGMPPTEEGAAEVLDMAIAIVVRRMADVAQAESDRLAGDYGEWVDGGISASENIRDAILAFAVGQGEG